VAIGRVERLYYRSRIDYVHHAVMDDGDRLGLAGSHPTLPSEAELRNILLIDLIQGAIALRVISAAVHQPVVWTGLFKHLGGDRLEVLNLSEGARKREEQEENLPRHNAAIVPFLA